MNSKWIVVENNESFCYLLEPVIYIISRVVLIIIRINKAEL